MNSYTNHYFVLRGPPNGFKWSCTGKVWYTGLEYQKDRLNSFSFCLHQYYIEWSILFGWGSDNKMLCISDTRLSWHHLKDLKYIWQLLHRIRSKMSSSLNYNKSNDLSNKNQLNSCANLGPMYYVAQIINPKRTMWNCVMFKLKMRSQSNTKKFVLKKID